jgi:hypothetical protein
VVGSFLRQTGRQRLAMVPHLDCDLSSNFTS